MIILTLIMIFDNDDNRLHLPPQEVVAIILSDPAIRVLI